jgi:hypothetical protein
MATLPATKSDAPNEVSWIGTPSPSANTPAATAMKLSNDNRKTIVQVPVRSCVNTWPKTSHNIPLKRPPELRRIGERFDLGGSIA